MILIKGLVLVQNKRFGSCSEHLFNSYVLYSMLCGDLEFIKGSTFGTRIQVF